MALKNLARSERFELPTLRLLRIGARLGLQRRTKNVTTLSDLIKADQAAERREREQHRAGPPSNDLLRSCAHSIATWIRIVAAGCSVVIGPGSGCSCRRAIVCASMDSPVDASNAAPAFRIGDKYAAGAFMLSLRSRRPELGRGRADASTAQPHNLFTLLPVIHTTAR